MATRRPSSDSTAYLWLVVIAWLGILTGFGPNAVLTVLGERAPREFILHVHALVFLGWMAILAAQVWLVRIGRTDLHRSFGALAGWWAVLIVAIGLVTALHVHRENFDAGRPYVGLATSFGSITMFSVGIVAAFALRHRPDWHKRLVIVATIGILAAAFSRALGPFLRPYLADDAFGDWVWRYAGSNMMILLAVGWDMVSRRSIHPAWLIGAPFLVMTQAVTTWVRFSPGWPEIAQQLLGR